MCLKDNSSKFKISTDKLRSSFSGFDALKCLLRRECFGKYHTPLFDSMPLLHSELNVGIVLDFKLKRSASLVDICLGILPLCEF